MIGSNLKVSAQVNKAVLTANRVLGMISRAIEIKTRDVIIPLYRALVRPHLEYCIQAWRPFLVKDIEKLERVQKRAVGMIIDLRSESYAAKLKEIGLFSLEKRRIRGDLIETFKMMKGLTKVNNDIFFSRNFNNTRDHNYKLFKPHCNMNIRKYFFSHRVIDMWNRLPTSALQVDTVSSFKEHVDNFLKCFT